MNFGQAFTFVFEDPDWVKKVGLAALVSLIPIVGQIFIVGWSLEIARRVVLKDHTPLPNLDFGRQLVDGLKGMLIALVYTLPVFVILAPIWILTAMSGSMDEETLGVLMAVAGVCCGGLVVIYSLLLAFAVPAAYANFIVKDQLSAAFNFNEVFGLVRSAPGAYLLVFLGVLVANGFIAPLGTVACGVGVVITTAYAFAVNGHLYGQAYNEAMRNRGYAAGY